VNEMDGPAMFVRASTRPMTGPSAARDGIGDAGCPGPRVTWARQRARGGTPGFSGARRRRAMTEPARFLDRSKCSNDRTYAVSRIHRRRAMTGSTPLFDPSKCSNDCIDAVLRSIEEEP
jgi:hypothetical protein